MSEPTDAVRRDRYAQCDDTCTVDCGACKGLGRPLCSCWPHPQGQWHFLVGYTHRRDCRLHPSYEPPDLDTRPAAPTAGPGEDARAEAREQIAEQLINAGLGAMQMDDLRRIADAVLAVPAVAEALALRGRVEAVADDLGAHADSLPSWSPTGALRRGIARDLRRALGEDGQ